MPKITSQVNDDGSASVVIETDDALTDAEGEPLKDESGKAVMQSSRWNFSRLDQAEKHLPTLTDQARGAARMSPGDASAFADQVEEVRKQIES